MQELDIPKFLQVNNEDDVHNEIFALIPDEYDKSEAQHLWNFTRPTAHIVAEMRGFDIPEAIRLIWPKFSYGEYLDYHAELRNMTRKEAQYATGEITFTGTPGTIIPSGYTISTESKNNTSSQDYVTDVQCIIGDDGTVTVQAKAAVAGAEGNAAANTIIVNTSSYDDVTSVVNLKPFTGGVKEEDDDSLYARIYEYDSTQGDSNIGNPSDYKRWAESYPGTGTAKVIRPSDTSGKITIILTDGNGEPASTSLCESVYNYIMSPNDDLRRLAPCGASLVVIPPITAVITVKATVELTAGTILSVATTFAERLKEYFSEAIENKEILYQKVGRILSDIDGVYDYSELYVNDGIENIPLSDGVFPTISSSDIKLTLAE